MPRVTFVKSARKEQGLCRRSGCSKKIEVGQSYFWFANLIGKSSLRKNFCSDHRPKPSELTTSDKLSRIYEAQETLEDALSKATTCEDMAVALRDAATEAREVAEEYQESLSNMPDGLQQGTTGQEIEEKASNIESWADELESAADEIDEIDQDDDAECLNCDHPKSEHEDGGGCNHEGDGDDDEDDEDDDEEEEPGEDKPEPKPKPVSEPESCDCEGFELADSLLEEARSKADDACGNLSI